MGKYAVKNHLGANGKILRINGKSVYGPGAEVENFPGGSGGDLKYYHENADEVYKVAYIGCNPDTDEHDNLDFISFITGDNLDESDLGTSVSINASPSDGVVMKRLDITETSYSDAIVHLGKNNIDMFKVKADEHGSNESGITTTSDGSAIRFGIYDHENETEKFGAIGIGAHENEETGETEIVADVIADRFLFNGEPIGSGSGLPEPTPEDEGKFLGLSATRGPHSITPLPRSGYISSHQVSVVPRALLEVDWSAFGTDPSNPSVIISNSSNPGRNIYVMGMNGLGMLMLSSFTVSSNDCVIVNATDSPIPISPTETIPPKTILFASIDMSTMELVIKANITNDDSYILYPKMYEDETGNPAEGDGYQSYIDSGLSNAFGYDYEKGEITDMTPEWKEPAGKINLGYHVDIQIDSEYYNTSWFAVMTYDRGFIRLDRTEERSFDKVRLVMSLVTKGQDSRRSISSTIGGWMRIETSDTETLEGDVMFNSIDEPFIWQNGVILIPFTDTDISFMHEVE